MSKLPPRLWPFFNRKRHKRSLRNRGCNGILAKGVRYSFTSRYAGVHSSQSLTACVVMPLLAVCGVALGYVLGLEIIFSFWSIVPASFIAGMPLIVKQVQAAIRGETNRLIEASYVLGKSPAITFFRVVLPSIRKSIAIGLSLAFAKSLGEVGITLMLGGNISGRTSTISLEVYNAVFTGEYDRTFVLVFLFGTITLLLIFLTRRLAKE